MLGDSKMKSRLDKLLVEKGFCRTRSQARDIIKLGRVKINGKVHVKPGTLINRNCDISVERRKYVNRAAEKLEHALKKLSIVFESRTVCDIGASTGGFTQVALMHGARKIYAVDVGKGQLADEIRKDKRVVVLERVNARYLSRNLLGERVDIVLCDVSFISVVKVLPAIRSILKSDGNALVLVKPQFEVGPEYLHHGLVQDFSKHREAIMSVVFEALQNGLNACNIVTSDLPGANGNFEYFLHLSSSHELNIITEEKVIEVINAARKMHRGELL